MRVSAHVVIVVENLPVPFDRRVWMEARALRDLGYQVSVICPTGKGFDSFDEFLEGIRILRHPLVEARSMAGYLKEYSAALWNEGRLLRKLRREGNIDVIHICNPPDVLFLVTLSHKWFHGTRVVFDHHDINPELFEVKFGRRGIFHALLRVAERMTFATANVVISTNESYRRIAIERGRKSAEDVFIVKSAPDLEEYVPFPQEEATDDCLVGYVGIMAEQDGVDVLLEAASVVALDDPAARVRFRLIGGGPAEEKLHTQSENLGLTERVDFTGYLYGEDMRRALSECDIGVVPDPKNDYNDKCTMNKVLEYMALGVPIVQFDLVEGRRSAGEAAVYAEGNDATALAAAIVGLARDPALRGSLREMGLGRIEELQWSVQKVELARAYEHVLGRS